MNFTEWLDTLPFLEKAFAFIAFPSTIILIIQTVMLFFGGMDDVGMGSDTSGMDLGATDTVPEDVSDTSDLAGGNDLRFITSRGIIAFFTVAGWSGILCIELGLSAGISSFLAFLGGALALVGVAYLIRALLGLQSVNQINYKMALGLVGEVYLPIPPSASGTGQVSLVLGGTYTQYDAITNESEKIKTGEGIRVIDIIRGNVMVVEQENKKEE